MNEKIEIPDKSAVSSSDILKLLNELNDLYTPPISAHVDLLQYAIKIVENAELIFLKLDNKVIGVSALYCNDYENFTAYITTIGIVESKQRQGLGKKLLKRSIELAKTKGMKEIRLEVNSENSKAINFYKRHNFVVEQKKIKPLDGEYSSLWYIMKRDIVE